MKNTSCMTTNKTAFIDFDGTVIDVIPRYYGILCQYLEHYGDLTIPFEQYKEIKRTGAKDHEIVNAFVPHADFDIADYLEFKRSNLEDLNWLSKDVLIGDPFYAYKSLKKMGFQVFLLTQRRNKENLIIQLDLLGITSCFDEIVVVHPKPNDNVKFLYLKEHSSNKDVIIGDSIVEITAAKQLNLEYYFVESGLFSSSSLGIKEHIFKDYNEVVNKMYNNYQKE